MRVSLSLVAAVSIGATAASAAQPSPGALSRRALPALPPALPEDVQGRKAAASTSLAAAAVLRGGENSPSSSGVAHTAKVASLFGLWYALNVVYNIGNKKVLNALPLPWLVAVAQLGVGALYALAAWASGLRDKPWGAGAPRLQPLATVGLWHGVGQVATVLSLGAGAVSFTHIVKALEPFFSALVSAVVSREVLRPPVYATLLPVVGGVSLAVATELSFSGWAFGTALASNVAFALRAVLSKGAMAQLNANGAAAGVEGGPNGGQAVQRVRTLSAPSVFGVVTWAAFAAMLPLALAVEGRGAVAAWARAAASLGQSPGSGAGGAGGGSAALARQVFLSGLFHYLNNEVMYLVLAQVHPITLAVGNTLKRVVIIGVSLLVFRNPISPVAAAGSAVGVGGVLLYSLTKAHYDKLDAEEAKQQKGRE